MSIDTVRAFVAAHPYISAYLAIAVVSIALRIAGSAWWASVKASHPRLAGLIEVARGLGFDAPKILQGLLRIAFAMLPPPAGGLPAPAASSPAASSPPSTAAYRIAVDGLDKLRARRPSSVGFAFGAGAIPLSIILSASIGLALVGCPRQGARSPALEASAAVVTFGAEVVHVTDEACAATGKRLRELGDPVRAGTVTGICADALRPAADALEAVATGIDAGAAVSDQQIACAVALGVDAVLKVRPVLSELGAKLPARVAQFEAFARPWLPVAEGAVCS